MKKIYTLILSILIFFPFKLLACTAPPAYLTVPYYELISRTNRIALAETVKIDSLGGHQYEYHFVLKESVKGNVDSSFSMTFENIPSPYAQDIPDNDFDSHKSGIFWDQFYSRQWNGPDCEMHPRFQKGSTYLLFLDKPFHWFSFELITSNQDLWFQTVRNVVKSKNESYRLTQNVFEYLSTKKSVGIYKVLNCKREEFYDRRCYERKRLLHGNPDPLPKNPLDLRNGYRNIDPIKTEEALIVNYNHVQKDNLLWAYAYPIKNGVVDFSSIRSQIRISGSKKIKVKNLIAYFK